mmetsp:Transcript_50098/g.112557  ORF Transcript_50098/g.112557 Transcript_50098/m.112557 type:complete len:800 (+) Transcript_50098:40-2439(+)
MDASGVQVLDVLQANPEGRLHRDELSAVLQHLSPGEWTADKLEQLIQGLGVSSDGMVNVGSLFGPGTKASARIAVFSAVAYVRSFMQPLIDAFPGSFFVEETCRAETASFCKGAVAACLFVNDEADREVLEVFKENGIELLLLRCAGFDRVDLAAAEELGIRVVRVPAYSPWAVAEHAVSMVLTLNRRLHKARNRVRNGNYELSGLVGMDMNGKTAGVIGTGKIGQIAAKIFRGFGMRVVCYDPFQNDAMKELGCEYMDLDGVYGQSDVVSLHVPLLPSTQHLICKESIEKMKHGVILVNVSRGGLVNTEDLIEGLSSGQVKAAGLDVYENEQALFFKDFSKMDNSTRLRSWDETLSLLRSYPNVLITPHSAFLTRDALSSIRETTILNMNEYVSGKKELTNQVKPPPPGASAAQDKALEQPQAPICLNTPVARRVRNKNLLEEDLTKVATVFEGEPNTDVRVAVYSSTAYVRNQMEPLMLKYPKSFFVEANCKAETAHMCAGAGAVCLFVNDEAGKDVISTFKGHGIKLILLRCAGFDRVDLEAAEEAGIKVARVPAYSPYAVAEHAVSLAMCLNRHLHSCYNRVTEGIFTLSGLVGMDMNGKTCGILGTGKIGQIAARIFKGLGMEVLCYDVFKNDVITKELGCKYAELDDIYAKADVISVHVPLLPSTKHIISEESISKMKRGVILINVSRGALVSTSALLDGLTSGAIGAAGLDVYEHESEIFFKNFSEMDDNQRLSGFNHEFMQLRSFPNVVVTPHSAFLTKEALHNICSTTVENLDGFVAGKLPSQNEVQAKR